MWNLNEIKKNNNKNKKNANLIYEALNTRKTVAIHSMNTPNRSNISRHLNTNTY